LLRHLAALDAAARPARIAVISHSLPPFYPRLKELRLELEMFQKPVHLPSLMKVVETIRRD